MPAWHLAFPSLPRRGLGGHLVPILLWLLVNTGQLPKGGGSWRPWGNSAQPHLFSRVSCPPSGRCHLSSVFFLVVFKSQQQSPWELGPAATRGPTVALVSTETQRLTLQPLLTLTVLEVGIRGEGADTVTFWCEPASHSWMRLLAGPSRAGGAAAPWGLFYKRSTHPLMGLHPQDLITSEGSTSKHQHMNSGGTTFGPSSGITEITHVSEVVQGLASRPQHFLESCC